MRPEKLSKVNTQAESKLIIGRLVLKRSASHRPMREDRMGYEGGSADEAVPNRPGKCEYPAVLESLSSAKSTWGGNVGKSRDL